MAGDKDKKARQKKIKSQKLFKKLVEAFLNSFFFRTFSLLAALALLLALVFAVMPKDAYIVFQQECPGLEVIDAQFTTIRWTGIEIDLREFDDLRIEPGKGKTFTVAGEIYDDRYCLLIHRTDEGGHCVIAKPKGTSEPFVCVGMTLEFLPHKQIASFRADGGVQIKGLDDCYFQSHTPIEIAPYGAETSVLESETKQQVAYYPVEADYVISIEDCDGASVVSKGNAAALYGCADMTVELGSVELLSCQGKGSLDYTYAGANQRFDIEDRPVELTAKANALTGMIAQRGDRYDVALAGTVTRASVAGSPLQPTFAAWLRQNAAALPEKIVALGGER